MSDLWMYHTPMVVVRKGDVEDMSTLDFEKQAHILCAMLAQYFPSGTVRAFEELMGLAPNTISDIGNNYELEKVKRKVSPETKEKIKQHQGSCREVAQEFGVSHTFVARLRRS